MITTASLTRMGRYARLIVVTLSLMCWAAPSRAVVISDTATTQATEHAWSVRNTGLATEAGILEQISMALSEINFLVKDYFGEMAEKLGTAGKLLIEGTKTTAKLISKLADARIDNDTKNVRLEALMNYQAEHAAPKHEYLCKSILMHQLAMTTEEFEHAVGRMALKAIESMYRGPNDDGNGPQYVADVERLRCEARFASPADGYDEKCIDSTTLVGPNKRTFIDADLTPFSMDGSVTLELPKMNNDTITVEVKPGETSTIDVIIPDPGTDPEQRMWLAGLYYCYQLAGPRPSPPFGEEKMNSPEGRMARARFDHALAMQSAFVKQCTDLLAYYTSPNSEDPNHAMLIADQNEKCEGARGIIDDETLKNKFGDCKVGLSPYQADYISQAECKSPQHYLSQAQGGASQPSMSDEVIMCSTSWNNWAAKVAAKQGALADAVLGLQKIKRNWMGTGKQSSWQPGALDSKPYGVVSYEKKQASSVGVHKVSALKQGLSVAADEMAWPATVSP